MPKKIILSILALIIIVTIAVGGFFLIKTGDPAEIKEAADSIVEDQSEGLMKESKGEETGGCESNTRPIFTADITDFSKVSFITPPVTITGGDLTTHGHIHLEPENTGKVPVYSAVDARLYEGAFYNQGGEGLYFLLFEVSCEVRFMHDHITDPVDKIKNEFSKSPASDSRTNKVGPVEFKAGELIGYTGGTSLSNNWDYGVYNLNEENPYRDEKYEQGDTFRYANAVCPSEYFTDELKSKYKKLFTDSYGDPVDNPTNLCSDL